MTDELAGFPSQEQGVDFIIGRRGSNQWLGHAANHHDGTSTLGPRGNRVQEGRLPKTSGPSIGQPDAVNPTGRHASASVTD
jgi:hypothetical protein